MNANFDKLEDAIDNIPAGPAGTDGADGADSTVAGPQGPDGADGVVNGVACEENQIVRYNGSAWVCATDPFANSCAAGDALRYNGAEWVCTAAGETGYLRTENFTLVLDRADSVFTSVSSNISVNSYCYLSPDSCYISLDDVTDHASCFTSVDTDADPTPMVENGTGYILFSNLNALTPGQRLNIKITCLL